MAPDDLTAAERSALHAELLDARTRVADQLASLDLAFQQLVDAADLEPPDDEHDPDGTTAYERAQVSSLAREARRQLVDLDLAIAASARPGFGRCEVCGRAIGLERLRAVPGTRTCVACATRGGARRPG
ncbi:TraR/DksA C4-type zinc finger protein [Aquihabitans sp. G128]|uniref:TraR/DksA family transcriptional regulator n=1 Tax=Aquihabitans sp. G128 TaxID=2849779 RepID=UPI001C2151FD|nr:TraR/DksA C4-type zinc finger protein [Aquihabitans sp. G128]QXC61131.1 TraR/DksA C4-type zinc finger protein [Aquihabitans sp. G128]